MDWGTWRMGQARFSFNRFGGKEWFTTYITIVYLGIEFLFCYGAIVVVVAERNFREWIGEHGVWDKHVFHSIVLVEKSGLQLRSVYRSIIYHDDTFEETNGVCNQIDGKEAFENGLGNMPYGTNTFFIQPFWWKRVVYNVFRTMKASESSIVLTFASFVEECCRKSIAYFLGKSLLEKTGARMR
ncbi:hypothetical protein CEXT_464141 [Caerostris extrusa]|uniref:Uncharacterized protein n=1 Tax=Caerostris extrusa TaxID=172846 RepID=A0AAV4VPC6_CAEEX|nr:hypothetical protein CEXT_464141 [Caerostris extrusa]